MSERNAAAIALQELVGKQIGLTDLGALDLYDEASATLCPPSSREPIENLGKLRLFAVKAKPKDEDFVKKCLGACLRRDDLANSQQVSSKESMSKLVSNFIPHRLLFLWRRISPRIEIILFGALLLWLCLL